MSERKAITGKRVLRYLAIGVVAILLVLVVLAFLGPALSQIPNEPCLTVGCESRIYVVLSGEVPAQYKLTMESRECHVSLRCVDGTLEPGSVERVNAGYGVMYQDADETTCTSEGVYIEGFAPLKFSVSVEWEAGTKMKRYRPRFDYCSGTCCLCKTIYLDLP